MLMKERTEFIIGRWGILVFVITKLTERYLLVSNSFNAGRDQYISTTFITIAVFSFALEYKGKVSKSIAKLGQECST